MSAALRDLMLAAQGAGQLDGAGVRRGRAEHPVCGDVIALDVRWEGEVIADLAWQARGCPACMAVAAAAPGLRGVSFAAAGDSLHRRLEQLGGLAPHERHAERLLLCALDRAR